MDGKLCQSSDGKHLLGGDHGQAQVLLRHSPESGRVIGHHSRHHSLQFYSVSWNEWKGLGIVRLCDSIPLTPSEDIHSIVVLTYDS